MLRGKKYCVKIVNPIEQEIITMYNRPKHTKQAHHASTQDTSVEVSSPAQYRYVMYELENEDYENTTAITDRGGHRYKYPWRLTIEKGRHQLFSSSSSGYVNFSTWKALRQIETA